MWRKRWEQWFPGPASSFDEKLAWLKRVETDAPENGVDEEEGEEEEEEEGEEVPDSEPPFAGEVVPGILFDSMGDSVELCLVLPRSQVSSCAVVDETAFLASSERRRAPFDPDPHQGRISALVERVVTGVRRLVGKKRARDEMEASVTAFFDWLETAPAGVDLGDDLVLLASLTCAKGDDLDQSVADLMLKLGIVEVSCTAVNDDLTLGSRVGDNLYVLSGLLPQVPVVVDLSTKKLRTGTEALDELQAQNQTFTYLVVESTRADDQGGREEEDESKDEAVVWLPAFYEAEKARLWAHCLQGDGETSVVRRVLTAASTESGNLSYELFAAEFEGLKERFGRGYKAPDRESMKLCGLLALTTAMGHDTTWLGNAEVKAELADLVSKRMATQWRELLKLDQSKLGLGLPDHPTFTPQASRAALLRCLANLQTAFAAFDIKFNYKARSRSAGTD